MNTTKVIHQAKMNAWAESIRDQQESTLSVEEWCQQHQVTKHQFYYWKKKLKDQFVESQIPEIVPVPQTVLQPSNTSCTSCTTRETVLQLSGSSSLKITINDISIEITEDISDLLLAKVIKAVRYA